MASVYDPRTCRVILSWRPTLEYYDQRYRVLKSFEEEKLLVGFQASETQVVGRLHGGEQLTIGPSALIIDGHVKEATNFGRLLDDAARRCLERLKPSVTGIKITTRHIVGLDHLGDYDAARITASRIFLGPFSIATNAIDFAALVDGRDDSRKIDYHTEFGIVSRMEGFARLARDLELPQTRSAPRGRSTVEANVDGLTPSALPPVSLFLESSVTARSLPSPGTSAASAWVSSCYRTAITVGVDACKALFDLMREPDQASAKDGADEVVDE